MKRHLPLIAMLAMAVPSASAAPVGVQQAQSTALRFVQRNAALRQAGSAATLTLAHEARSASGVTDFYVFSRGTGAGFVIVSGDDATVPVLAYSDAGTFMADDMPANVNWWMQQYQRQIQVLRDHPEAARRAVTLATSVSPLTTTTWKQSTPYNQEIPTSRFALGTYRPVVGCVALAMAQLMKVHNWPTTGEGSHSYTWTCTNGSSNATSATTYSANFGSTTYQWSSMKDSYGTSADATAVGTLCYHCGVAVDMQYGVDASGAQIYDAMKALKTYFRYDKGLDLYLRDFYDADEWDEMLRADLDQGLPILYGGSTQETQYAAPSGHCFVFDGYDTGGMFHINWGWGGSYDGYFATSLLDSGRSNANFSSWQQAVLGAKPDRDGTSTGTDRALMGYMIDFSTAVTSAALGADVAVTMAGVTFLGEGDLSAPWWGVNILNEAETQVIDAQYFVDATGIQIGATYSADESAAFTVPGTLAPGTYHVRAVYSLDQDATRHDFVRPATGSKYIKMVVEGSTATFSEGTDVVDPVTVTVGDVNGDGSRTMGDVTLLIGYILNNDATGIVLDACDVSADGAVTMADVTALIALVLGA